MPLLIPVSWGELLDKITILEIKARRITAPVKQANVRQELAALIAVRDARQISAEVMPLIAQLQQVNADLWDIEDEIRSRERTGDFGPEFIALARRVYLTNDRRAALKRHLNQLLDSELMEEKMYAGGEPEG